MTVDVKTQFLRNDYDDNDNNGVMVRALRRSCRVAGLAWFEPPGLNLASAQLLCFRVYDFGDGNDGGNDYGDEK